MPRKPHLNPLGRTPAASQHILDITVHHSAVQHSTRHQECPKRLHGCPSGGLRSHVPFVVSRQLTSHMHPAPYKTLQRISGYYNVSQRITMHHKTPQRISRHHSASQTIIFYAKVPRKRVRNLMFPCRLFLPPNQTPIEHG